MGAGRQSLNQQDGHHGQQQAEAGNGNEQNAKLGVVGGTHESAGVCIQYFAAHREYAVEVLGAELAEGEGQVGSCTGFFSNAFCIGRFLLPMHPGAPRGMKDGDQPCCFSGT